MIKMMIIIIIIVIMTFPTEITANLGCPDFMGVFSNQLWLLLLRAQGKWLSSRCNMLVGQVQEAPSSSEKCS